ncbi:MAG: phosphate-selective porin OprO and OprP, partial [Acidobacteriota bacterium]|nr:phosphate-selective porin OprO and OprP [Acidobacteriota bacterium]
PFSYELLALSVILPHQERILSPFFVTRSIGAQLSGLLAGDRMTWAAGVFNDWLDTDLDRQENGTDYAGRLTGLVYESPSRTDYLHLGLGLRRVGSDDGVMRFSGRPESNVADKFVDTGNFAGEHADELLVELLWSHRQFSLLAERVEAHVDAPASGDPRFSGYYGTASWILTGESRPYVRASGYAGGLSPLRRWGALEFALRYSHLDLTDGAIDGGELDKWSYNLSWWASAQWKIGLTYGDADLDRSGLTGNTKMWLARIQWLY